MPLQLLADCRELRGEVIRHPAAVALSRRDFDPDQGRTAQEFRREAAGVFGPGLERHALEVAAAASGIDEEGREERYAAPLDEFLVAAAEGPGPGAAGPPSGVAPCAHGDDARPDDPSP